MPSPLLSFIVVLRNMAREAPRTLYTLSAEYQRGVSASEYEVVVLDAGSQEPVSERFVRSFGHNFRLVRSVDSPSPAAAVNAAARRAEGEAIGLCIDGARMLTPGIVRMALTALRAYEDPVIATLAWHLGPKLQNQSVLEGYSQVVEDRLLDSVAWRKNGYELFRVSSLAWSSAGGWFAPISESNCIVLRRSAWHHLGGLNESFRASGGGLVNLDFYREACERLGQLVILLGEGTFHQFHGGVSTNVPAAKHPWPAFHVEYRSVRKRDFAPPETEPEFLGKMTPHAMRFIAGSRPADRMQRLRLTAALRKVKTFAKRVWRYPMTNENI